MENMPGFCFFNLILTHNSFTNLLHPMQRNFLFLLGSGRRNGNSEQLARQAAQYLPAEVPQQWLHLLDLPLLPFEDLRHSIGIYPQPLGNVKVLFDATLAASDIVFVTPLYWYSVSASMKLYLDYWSAWFRVPGADFRKRMVGKTAWAVTSYSDEGDERLIEPLVSMLRMSADYMEMPWGETLAGYGNRPGDVLADAACMEQAKGFFGVVGDLRI